jgi:hypothetical protein
MELRIYKALWGMTGSIDSQLYKIRDAGYYGVEAPAPEDRLGFRRQLEERGLAYIAMVFADDSAMLDHGVGNALEAGAHQITAHSGRDHFSFAEGCTFFADALKIADKHGVRIGHETHRGRILFTPWTTAAYLREFPSLQIVADFSHFTCVGERLFAADDPDIVLAAQRTIHLHARVGYDQGPQVPDPAAPEYDRFLNQFEQYWDIIRQSHLSRGEEVMTVDPEYGPPGYMHTLPYTNQPVADLWDICAWTAYRLSARWMDETVF